MTTLPVSRPRVSPLSIAIGIVVLIGLLLVSAASFYTDFLWFEQLGYSSVFLTEIVARIAVFVIAFLLMTGLVGATLGIAWKTRPIYLRMPDESPFAQYQKLIESIRRLVLLGVPVLVGVFAGLAAANQWANILTWTQKTEFGIADPHFGLDVSFFVFDLPFYLFLISFVSAGLLISALVVAGVHLIYGGIRITGREIKVAKAARIQIAVLLSIYMLAQGVSLWLDQYSTATSSSPLFTGVNYTDANAIIPGTQILALISIVVAAVFLFTAFIARWRFAILATALMVVSSLVLGNLYPWLVQTFQVVPNERTLEGPYLQRNIDSTRVAFGLDKVEVVDYDAKVVAEPGALRQDAQTTASIRILDPALVSDAFRQLEQYRQYYSFPNRLHVSRYLIDGQVQDTVLAVRELNQAGLGESQSWYNSTIVYTHGFGIVAAYGNKRDVDGKPEFLQSGIPSVGALGEFEPRVYFGQNSPTYSIVGGNNGEDLEFDFPAGRDGESETYTTFSGDGGPRIGDLLTRIAYALKFQSEQILLSDAINPDSQILYNRNPRERVAAVAPFLTLDSEVYPAVVDGRIKWIVDGYTTSNDFPYSNIESFNQAILDSSSETQRLGFGAVNYIRNSVKATVDAYDGSVDLYQWDEKDPILQTWMKIYPDLIQSRSNMSSELMSQVRYPSDLFKVQRNVLGRYHVDEAGAFYSQQDAWMTPNDPVEGVGIGVLQPPYYLTMKVPGTDAPAFSLYSTFIPKSTGESSRNVLTGYLVANADAGRDPGKISEDYGKLTLLSLPRDTIVPGPGQVQNNFNADSNVSSLLNILRQGSTRVLNGNLLTLPVGGGLLYVQPVYIESTGETSFPLLQKVLVAFGDRIAFEDTLDQALDSLFGGDSGASAGDSTTDQTETGGESATQSPVVEGDNPALNAALSRAQAAINKKQAAMKAGDWTAYGAADAELVKAIEDALKALGE